MSFDFLQKETKMKIKLLFIGKLQADVFQEALMQYIRKINHYFSFEQVAIPYLKNNKTLSQDEQKKLEGELILKKISANDYVILLDERGRQFSSVEFSAFIQQQANAGSKNMVFIIGGVYGFSSDVYLRKNQSVSLSKMTFPHIMTRLIFAEQLYRACTILHHEPYHHE
jgi:23S rRNA (pseudouridine1915-N3)-methyltransferase